MLDRLEWRDLPEEEARALLARTLTAGEVERLAGVEVSGWTASLSFYRGVRLGRIALRPSDGEPLEVFVLHDATRALLLDGTPAAVFEANRVEKLSLDESMAPDYLRLFCFAARADQGAFGLLEEMPAALREDGDHDPRTLELARKAHPLTVTGRDDDGNILISAVVVYDHTLFECVYTISPAGQTTMQDVEPIAAGVPDALGATHPDLHRMNVYQAAIGGWIPPEPQGIEVLRIMIELLLEEALGGRAADPLLAHFARRTGGRTALDHFADFVVMAAPFVAIESAIPFVEEIVGAILNQRSSLPRLVPVHRAAAQPGDDTRLLVTVPEDGPGLVLLPMHAYRSIVDVERVAHDLTARDVSCLVGCERVADLPPSLRSALDMTVRLPALTPPLFAALFMRVMGSALPDGWDADDTHWVPHVLHSDLQQPQGLRLAAAGALAYVRERVERRLRAVDPEQSLGLRQLHGLGEARGFAEDLIADIHAAVAGTLPWAEVDRGVLLVGPPGTGKTTLARAIARDCGVKFVQASAASWQTAGHLGDHIRAIRGSFAQARRHAPAILFIDEIDSIGSRERFSGDNAQYHTEVVNALLEQMQGLDPEAPVFVIAATNHQERVDPALKRAGRLDRVIAIPYPNAEALAHIFDHYLAPHVARNTVGGDVDTRVLGALSLGLTGADVERFVRGAVRRARKAGRPIAQAELIAEITNKPREPDSVARMTPEEVRRVAVHESGHAVAACLGSERGHDITFLTIVPRADGSLGFLARMPSARVLLTRREYIERIEVMLAGRAAEEIVFGADGITGGAGGGDVSSDLAVATQAALRLVMQYGLGPGNSLLWLNGPGPSEMAQAAEILAAGYDAVRERLVHHEAALLAIADALLRSQELTGDEVRAIVAATPPTPVATNAPSPTLERPARGVGVSPAGDGAAVREQPA